MSQEPRPTSLSSQLFPIWWMVVVAVSAYAALHHWAPELPDAPCEIKELTFPWLAVAPVTVVFGVTVAGVIFAAIRRPLAVIKARICAHVARVLLALVLAAFSFALLGVTIQTLAAFDRPSHSAPSVALTTGQAITTPRGEPVIRLRRADEVPRWQPPMDSCAAAQGFVHRNPFWTGLIFTLAVGAVGGALALLIGKGNPRTAARIVRALPSRRWRWVVLVAVLAWPTVLVVQAFANASANFIAHDIRLIALLGSGALVVWWAIDRVFSGLALLAAAGREFDDYTSSPHASYQAAVASWERADILVFSDMHLSALSEGHPLRTMDSDTQAFDDGTSTLVNDLLARMKPRAIIVAGDVTDTGHATSWERAACLLKRADIPTYVAPGNHDVHFRWLTPELVDQRGAIRLVLREAFSMDEPHDVARDSVAEDELARSIDSISPAGRKVEGSWFPILHRHDELRLLVLVLNSNRRPPDSPLTNAIGLVGDEQLSRARTLLVDRPAGYGLIVVLHHHVVPPADLEHHAELRCEDANAVITFAAEQKAVAIIHGHKHMPYTVRHTIHGADGDHELWVISCGSTLYKAAGPRSADVQRASAVGLRVEDGDIKEVAFFPQSG